MLKHSHCFCFVFFFFSEDKEQIEPTHAVPPRPGNSEHAQFAYDFAHPFSHLEFRIQIRLGIYSALIKKI